MTPVLEMAGVAKTFAGIRVLSDLEIVLEEGALLGLVGANGAGKTTVLNVIGGQVTPDIGRIRLAGRDIGALPAWKRAVLGLGRTFQESRLWPDLTVKVHFLVALNASRSEAALKPAGRAIEEMLSLAELSSETLDQRPGQMRLLDRRRVELAMAGLNATNILLIDEIGAGLETQEATTLYRLIERLIRERRSRAAILVEHRLDLLAAFATEIGLIDAGRILEHASSNEPARVSSLMERMFDRRSVARTRIEIK